MTQSELKYAAGPPDRRPFQDDGVLRSLFEFKHGPPGVCCGGVHLARTPASTVGSQATGKNPAKKKATSWVNSSFDCGCSRGGARSAHLGFADPPSSLCRPIFGLVSLITSLTITFRFSRPFGGGSYRPKTKRRLSYARG